MQKENYTFRMDANLKKDLVELAKHDQRTLSGYIHKTLQDHSRETKRAKQGSENPPE